jgi:hypothetical protein
MEKCCKLIERIYYGEIRSKILFTEALYIIYNSVIKEYYINYLELE